MQLQLITRKHHKELGGFVSGGLTLGMMTTMGNRLIKHLKANPFKPDVSKETILV
jgi:hypothetical protein